MMLPVRARRQVGLRPVGHGRRRPVGIELRHGNAHAVNGRAVVFRYPDAPRPGKGADCVDIRRQVTVRRPDRSRRLDPQVRRRHVLRRIGGVDNRPACYQ